MFPAFIITILLGILLASSSSGDIFYYRGPDGVVYFTNVPVGNRPWKFYLREPRRKGRDRLYVLIEDISRRHGIDPLLVRAMIEAESGFDLRAISPKGAMGLMQLMPSIVQAMGLKDPFDPAENIEAGVRYLKVLLERFGHDLTLALAAYNAGPEAVKLSRGVPPYAETRGYVQKVLRVYRSLKGR